MGIAYVIKCRHCGTEFNYSQDESMGMMPRCVGCESYVETENQRLTHQQDLNS